MKVDLVLAKLSFNCEKIALEVSPLKASALIFEVGAFGEVEYAFQGTITVGMGSRPALRAAPAVPAAWVSKAACTCHLTQADRL
ncbi:hypothetical protein ACFSC4_16175 [Deinococcus malanensis]|uniref:hypothetical protein n=1 Tax=Deinococcus malanensis TaxID=1706855 RepID=UPI003629558C